jgi:hypothetical protein
MTRFIVISAVNLLMLALMVTLATPQSFIPQMEDVRAPYNPPPFQGFLASPSAPIRRLLSRPSVPLADTLPATPGPDATDEVVTQDVGTVTGCGTEAGTVFNRESRVNASVQHTQAIDLLRNRVSPGVDLVVGGSTDARNLGADSTTGYYVSLDGDCTPEFEGGLPAIFEFSDRGIGSPAIAADPARDAIFMADLRLVFDDTVGVGLFRTTAATLMSSSTCPSGTHGIAAAESCWPTRVHLTHVAGLEAHPQDKPHLAVDERASGTGAGNVYVTATQFDFGQDSTKISLVACRNDLSACSQARVISGSDADAHLSHVAVRPDGEVTVTYVNAVEAGTIAEIRYVRCTPRGAPSAPTCAGPTLVHEEVLPLRFGGFLAAQSFPVATYPQHAHRVDSNGTETYVVWDRCKVAPIGGFVCPDADVVMKASRSNGTNWSGVSDVHTGVQDQFLPAVRTDSSRNIINIAHYSSSQDTTFQRRLRVILHHILPGGGTPDPLDSHTVTTLMDDPSGDPQLRGAQFTDYLGLAARGTGADGQSRAYVHHTAHNVQGTYGGIPVPESNNHLSRLDY